MLFLNSKERIIFKIIKKLIENGQLNDEFNKEIENFLLNINNDKYNSIQNIECEEILNSINNSQQDFLKKINCETKSSHHFEILGSSLEKIKKTNLLQQKIFNKLSINFKNTCTLFNESKKIGDVFKNLNKNDQKENICKI